MEVCGHVPQNNDRGDDGVRASLRQSCLNQPSGSNPGSGNVDKVWFVPIIIGRARAHASARSCRAAVGIQMWATQRSDGACHTHTIHPALCPLRRPTLPSHPHTPHLDKPQRPQGQLLLSPPPSLPKYT
eukprot:340184-Chlamydomonas_euryale.AAC.2